MTPDGGYKSVWTYEDLGILLGSILPGLLLAGVIGSFLQGEGRQAVLAQSWLYLWLLGVLYLLATKRHGQPLWKSLGWVAPFRGAWWCAALAPLLAIGISAAGALLQAPPVSNAAEQLLDGNVPLLAVGVFAAIIGPAFEELLFRGFLQPLLEQSLPVALAISLAALPFAMLHGPQYEWSWQHVLLIFAAGCVFGYVRHRTGTTTASALMHMGYNLTLFAAFVSQQN